MSSGSDPYAAVVKFAESKGKDMAAISLGQGRGAKALKLIEEGMVSDREAIFFEGIATLLSNQIRSLVEHSLDDYLTFYKRYDVAEPLSPWLVKDLSDRDPRQQAFFTVSLCVRNEEARFKQSLDQIQERLLKVFTDMVAAMKDMPRPDQPEWKIGSYANAAKSNSQQSQGKDKGGTGPVGKPQRPHLAEMSMEEQHVMSAYLLTEEPRVRAFLEDPNRTRDEYLKEVERLRKTEKEVIKNCPNEIRMVGICMHA